MREFDDVARDRRQAERGGVDQPQLAPLHLVHLAALPALQRLGEHENGRQRRAEVVGDVHEQRESVAPRQLLGKGLRPVRLQRDAHALHRDEQRQQLRVRHADFAPALHDFAAQQLEQPAAERRVNFRIGLGPSRAARGRVKPGLMDRGRDECEQLGGFGGAGRAGALAPSPPGQHGTNGVLEHLAGDAADIRAEGMCGGD